MTYSIEDLEILNEIKRAVAANNEKNGFRSSLREDMTDDQWNGRLGQLVRAAVCTANQHGESSEFWEAFRRGQLHEPCDKGEKMTLMGLPVLSNAEEEIADEIIRAIDKADVHGVDVAKAVAVKMAYNAGRPFRHGNKLA